MSGRGHACIVIVAGRGPVAAAGHHVHEAGGAVEVALEPPVREVHLPAPGQQRRLRERPQRELPVEGQNPPA